MDDDSMLTFKDLQAKKNWPHSADHTRRLVLAGKFPKPFKPSAGGRLNLWRESDIDAFFAERAKAQD